MPTKTILLAFLALTIGGCCSGPTCETTGSCPAPDASRVVESFESYAACSERSGCDPAAGLHVLERYRSYEADGTTGPEAYRAATVAAAAH